MKNIKYPQIIVVTYNQFLDINTEPTFLYIEMGPNFEEETEYFWENDQEQILVFEKNYLKNIAVDNFFLQIIMNPSCKTYFKRTRW